MISKEEVKHIAKLARLGLTEKEVGKYQKELSSILDYIEKLKIELPKEAKMKKKTKSSSPEVDVSKIEPTSHSIRVENVLRNDEIRKHAPYRTEGSGAGLMELAPETKQGFLKVKSIFK